MAERMAYATLEQALRSCRPHLLAAAVFSLGINLLYLASPLYMMQVYNRVVTSGSSSTLLMLTIVVAVAFVALALLDLARARVLSRAGMRLENRLSEQLFSSAFRRQVMENRAGPLRDFETLRQAISGAAIYPLFDLPWTPIFIIAAFLLHPWLGVFVIGCGLVIGLLALLNEGLLRGPLKAAASAKGRAIGFTDMSLRHAETVVTLGMTRGIRRRWREEHIRELGRQRQVTDRSGTMSSAIKSLRLAMQSLALGLGAWLVISHSASAGVMFAGSLLLSRTLQPIEQITGSWRTLAGARAAYVRLSAQLGVDAATRPSTKLPVPVGLVSIDNLHLAHPGGVQRLILRAVTFRLEPGTVLGILGPSAAGKTALARAMVGLISPSIGSIRLDGASLSSWTRDDLGRHIGYLPQRLDLLADTVATNIGRFETEADDDIIAAARLVGAHEAILQLPLGYDTPLSENGVELPGALIQRIGLARAFFRLPTLVVLDEPGTNLDAEGEQGLARAIMALKQANCTVVIVSPRQSTLATIDRLLLLRNGGMEMFGDRDAVISDLEKAVRTAPPRRPMVAHG